VLTKENLLNLLKTNDKILARALVVLNQRQTSDEQATEGTRYQNGRGFRPCHARMGTSMAKFFERRGYLSPKQIAYWRETDKSGAMRIGIYWAQLLEEAEAKSARVAADKAGQAAPAAPVVAPVATDRDVGTEEEDRMILNEISGETPEADNDLDKFMSAVKAKR